MLINTVEGQECRIAIISARVSSSQPPSMCSSAKIAYRCAALSVSGPAPLFP